MTYRVQVALWRRLPRSRGAFDYGSDVPLAIGTVVRVPLRATFLVGVVCACAPADDAREVLPVQEVVSNLVCSQQDVAYWQFLARTLYQSIHSIVYAALPQMPKRSLSLSEEPAVQPVSVSVPPDEVPVVQELSSHCILNGWQQVALPSEALGLAALAHASVQDPRPWVVFCPDLTSVSQVASVLRTQRFPVRVLGGRQGIKERWRAWMDLRNGTAHVVTTRSAAFTLPSQSARVIVWQSGDELHTQADQNPHIDVRRVLRWSHEHQHTPVTLLDVLPRVEDGPLILDAWAAPPVHLVDLTTARVPSADWLVTDDVAQAIQNASTKTAPFFLYLNRVEGADDRLDVSRAVSKVRALFPDTEVFPLRAQDPLPTHGIVVCTRTLLRRLPLIPRLSGCAVLLGQQEWTLHGFRSMEQSRRFLRVLASWTHAHGHTLWVQANDPNAMRDALRPTAELFEQELHTRERLGYPPYQDVHVAVSREESEVFALWRAQYPDTLGSARTLCVRRAINDPIDEWLTYPPSCDIFVSPDTIDL